MFEEEKKFREYVNNFIHNVFNYYNGKINIFNKAILIIDWANHYNSNNLANCKAPNKVTIFPMVIKRICNCMYDMMANVVECIIHELYHADQLIDYERVNVTDYNMSIEYPVEVETNLYIINHMNELYTEFGLDISTDYNIFLNRAMQYDVGYRYIRRDYLSHLLVCFKQALFDINDFRILESYIANIRQNIRGKIFLEINGITYYLYHDGECFNLNDLNEILNNTIYNGDIIYSKDSFVIIENGKCTIKFNDLFSTKIMC